jgi:hypothetical protein
MIIEFENVFESELVAALHRALDLAKANRSSLIGRIENLVDDAEHLDADERELSLQ